MEASLKVDSQAMRKRSLRKIIGAIQKSGFTIYDSLEKHPEFYIETKELEQVLKKYLKGLDLNYPLRTRSKVLKTAVCEALGYPVPISFQKVQPRFPGQNFDTYIQKADNLQIWNEEIAPSRRYVIIRVSKQNQVIGVKVITGELLATLDKTGTLTQKFQAKSRKPVSKSLLVSAMDTKNVRKRLLIRNGSIIAGDISDPNRPNPKTFISIADLFHQLSKLCGTVISDPGKDQERNRGAALHKAVCEIFKDMPFGDSGQFPDIPSQLVELKLQTSPTIDLGLVSPDSVESLSEAPDFHHCDVRYAIFYGRSVDHSVHLENLILCTGTDFFSSFQRFEGKIQNKKIQIPLPRDFFQTK